jgi:hypothetical protein
MQIEKKILLHVVISMPNHDEVNAESAFLYNVTCYEILDVGIELALETYIGISSTWKDKNFCYPVCGNKTTEFIYLFTGFSSCTDDKTTEIESYQNHFSSTIPSSCNCQ